MLQNIDVNIEDKIGETVLDYAARQDNIEVLELVIQSEVDLNHKSSGGYQQTAFFTPANMGICGNVTLFVEEWSKSRHYR